MDRSTLSAALLSISLDRDIGLPLHAQLARHLRKIILERRVVSGERLPSSRLLAAELSVSRVTITTAFDQLISEGYAEGRHGSGVYVSTDLPDYPVSLDQVPRPSIALPAPIPPKPFETAVPDLASFPHQEWARLLEQTWRAPDVALLARPDVFGWGPLRHAIAQHLTDWRGINCSPTQIVVTSGLVESIELIAKTALRTGDTVLTENPGHHVLRKALEFSGLHCKSAPVDRLGFNTQAAIKKAPKARAVAITPSRQFPLGMTLPLARRLELLEWAGSRNGFIIEDDFDSEYRFQGQPLPALMSLDDQDRVIYVGSFSKVLLPTLRLGFVVFPEKLIDRAISVIAETGPRASMLAQPVLATFMQSGAFATHIRRMRRLYAGRQKSLIAAIETEADDLLQVEPANGGMHVVVKFRSELAKRMSDIEASERAAKAGVTASSLSSYFVGKPTQQGLILGFSGYNNDAINDGVDRLAAALRR